MTILSGKILEEIKTYGISLEEPHKTTLREVIKEFQEKDYSEEWIFEAVQEIKDTENFDKDYLLSDGFAAIIEERMKEEEKVAEPEPEPKPEPKPNCQKITVRGDWVDYCHFARDRYPEVFKIYKAAAAGKNYGFTSSPNPYSDLLTKIFEEMGYKVNWIYEEWVNPNKEQKKEAAAAAETAAEPKKQEAPHYEFEESDDNKNKTKRQTELAEKYRGDKEITELLSI